MSIFLIILLVLTSLVLIVSILLQPGKSAGLSGSIGGGAESLFGKKKAKGYEAMLARLTTISAVILMLSALLLTIVQ